MTAVVSLPDNLAELLHQLGDITPRRVLLHPTPGTATPTDVLRLLDSESKRLCELFDGTLVEKPMGYWESRLTAELIAELSRYLATHDLGVLTSPDGPFYVSERQVRLPDMAFIRYERIPVDAVPDTAMPDWQPNLVVESVSPGNSKGEMDRKLQEYFDNRAELVWYFYPRSREVHVYLAPDHCQVLSETELLDGGNVLPGFQVLPKTLFDRAERLRPKSP
jgi:Uma2 family endonuclease